MHDDDFDKFFEETRKSMLGKNETPFEKTLRKGMMAMIMTIVLWIIFWMVIASLGVFLLGRFLGAW